MTTQHTPTPFNDRAASICNRHGLSYDASQEVMAEANKADELVAALEACMFALGRAGANVTGGTNRAEWERARAALAKVAGK